MLVAIERGTRRTYDDALKDGTTEAPTDALRPEVGTGAFLVTDGNSTCWNVAAEFKFKHDYFVSGHHGKGDVGELHMQSVNRYDSTLKTWISRFRDVATKYLPNCLGWRRFLDRFEDALNPQQFMHHALRERYLTPGSKAQPKNNPMARRRVVQCTTSSTFFPVRNSIATRVSSEKQPNLKFTKSDIRGRDTISTCAAAACVSISAFIHCAMAVAASSLSFSALAMRASASLSRPFASCAEKPRSSNKLPPTGVTRLLFRSSFR